MSDTDERQEQEIEPVERREWDDTPVKTALGLDQNVCGLLTYVLGWLTGVVFLLLEKDNPYVRFHAFQSLATFGGLSVLSIVSGFIPFIGWLINLAIFPVGLILWIVLMVKAVQGEMWQVPFVGEWAEEQAFGSSNQDRDSD